MNPVMLPTSSAPPDESLVVSARDGAEWAKEALFRRHFQRCFQLAFRLYPGPEAEDLAQDALVEALIHLEDLEAPATFGRWLRAIVVRTVKQRLRRRRIAHRLGLGASPDDVDIDSLVGSAVPVEVRIELMDVYTSLKRLSVEERLSLILSRVEGLTLDEAAEAMNLSVATIKRRVSAAAKALGARKEPA
jgi:RNA polymerase sigma-70 factor (ECF subfamily)